ncbi:Holliday junction resolvase RuvX [Candidatus Kaiserbacteria bacterium]|nr:Holliday junction resolvase RuvX [Candidatus Kaiserbacteria bacterium]
MRYLGIDYGEKRIGLALSDMGGLIASPHSMVSNDSKALAYITSLIRDEGVERLVMGDTRAVGGSINMVTPDAERFAQALTRVSGIPVDLAYEGWSSFEAARYAPGDLHDDSVAAAVILQRFIDMTSGDTVE